MKFAGAKAGQFCTKPDGKIWAHLIFGSDGGVVSDQALALSTSLSAGKPDVEIIRLSDDEIRKDPALFFDALEAVSLLGYDRIIRVQTSGDKIAKLLLEAIALGEEAPDRFAAKLIITAGALAKGRNCARRLNSRNTPPRSTSLRTKQPTLPSLPARN